MKDRFRPCVAYYTWPGAYTQHRSKVGSGELSNEREIEATYINDDPCNYSKHLLVKSSDPSGNHFCNQISYYHAFEERELASVSCLLIHNNFTMHRSKNKTDVSTELYPWLDLEGCQKKRFPWSRNSLYLYFEGEVEVWKHVPNCRMNMNSKYCM